ncbi:hypothetical protein MPDQ_007666 [Monascus purpureus]|uniref:t-SNARE coiled-coil homology domain-containing protein n=1 Tax=Monascus purpureus TaxID=5098 RepID=A0A507QVM0_MONPU|nr:hypothetical protein MPDQ_007666 [Monascus purpureus]UZG77104.1 SNARE protein [Monascus ruber]BDD55172.1 hypothetical protein MAP00_000719 [Monascus purpureus]
MPSPSQLFLLADHIKLSLLERQRAVSLSLEPNTQDKEISRSLDSLREGIEAAESEHARLEENNDSNAAEFKDELDRVRVQFQDLLSLFHSADGDSAAASNSNNPAVNQAKSSPTSSSSSPDIKQPVPQHPSSKSVRFMDASPSAAAGNLDDEDPNRSALFQPYRDSPSPPGVDTSAMSNLQIHEHHSQILRDQDDQLDRLGESIGRQHQLSIQIGDELEGHIALLDGMESDVDRHQSRLDVAKRRLNRIRKSAGENWSMMTIIGLIIVLVILIVILK